ncbi:PINc/VapC family ATPase [Candidatus Woesearchaeota archaeon]|nr:PINc/VapC family ATPase [Candidatus Woesearchaeota archaeon]MBW3005911.1 PINc/VapC family ATPase [Candidatus Woesearchaeota archaeon]
MNNKIVPDTSVIIEGALRQHIEKGELKGKELLLHEAVFAELENQANKGRSTGLIGLDELKKIQETAGKNKIKITISGKRPTSSEIKYAGTGEIDALIRQLAWDEDATLMTSDKVQAKVAEAKGMSVVLVPMETGPRKKIKLETYFDTTTMSVHLRENVLPMAKKGVPGKWQFVALAKTKLTAAKIKEISQEIIEEARSRADGFLEIEREGSTIIQLGPYRIVITRPPFSDGWEITAVKPIKRLSLADYRLSEKMQKRVAEQAEGILIAGAPGHGKTTFAQALSEYFADQQKIVKTVEAPRDLVLPDTITQLAISRGTPEEVHDVLLLSRPDYTVFDEMRNTPDFILYSDLRLAGVGMVGVIHGTNPLDAIQRFIGKLELGVIPHVIDTLVFIKNGSIGKVLAIEMVVKVPSGMTEADLARPVIVVSDFESGKAAAEIYSYGEETVVVPVTETAEKMSGAKKLAADAIEKAMQKYTDQMKIEMPSEHKAIVYVPKQYIAGIIGKEGKNISKLEERLGIGLDIRELGAEEAAAEKPEGKEIHHELNFASKYIEIYIGENLKGKDVDIYVANEYLATFNIGKKGIIRIKKSNPLGKAIMNAQKYGEKIRIFKT